jgi:enoyl-CoA hydratase/carnithine racemase
MSVRFETQGHVALITIDRPEARNAIDAAAACDIEAAIDRLESDDSLWVGVLTGTPPSFCAGADLRVLESGGLDDITTERGGFAGLVQRQRTKPLIAAVVGAAFAGGFEIVLACDLVIAADSAQFGLPEPLVGAIALGGGLHRLPRQIGLKPALGIILTGRKVGAAEGKALGFVNEVVTRADLAATVDRWTADILRCSPVATQASKEVVYRGLAEPSLADAMRNQRDYAGFRAWLESEDIREGPRAFAEKRSPNWSIGSQADKDSG